jgi:hypothetical protein
MKEYRVKWTQVPTAYNPSHVVFIEAASPQDAEAIARDHIERTHGVGSWIVFEVSESVAVPAGKVIGS